MNALIIFLTFFGTTIYVPADYPTIQWAVYKAHNGDTVEVSPGTYNENIVVYQRAITIQKGLGRGPAVIKGTAPGSSGYQSKACVSYVDCDEYGVNALLGFHITNGHGNNWEWEGMGLDICRGGGIFIYKSNVEIGNCNIYGNEVTRSDCNSGGAIATTLKYPSERGGASPDEYFPSTVNIHDCEIHDNYFEDLVWGWSNGSAIWLEWCLPGSVFSRNDVYNNTCDVPVDDDECAARISGDFIEFDSNKFYDNDGIGLFPTCCHDTDEFVMTNCVFSGHSRSGVVIASDGNYMINCTVTDNDFVGIEMCTYYAAPHLPDVTIINSVFWGNDWYTIGIWDEFCTAAVDYSCMEGGIGGMDKYYGANVNYGTHNITGNPLLDSTWHLLRGSPCVNSGDDNAANLPDEDFEGDDRIIGTHADIGADERK